MNEGDIVQRLIAEFASTSKFWLSNSYVYRWESDFWRQTKAGISVEFEVKVTRSDFMADFNKTERHEILQTGKLRSNLFGIQDKGRPNKFFYICPDGIIPVEAVPKYAGLIYLGTDMYNSLRMIKQAPYLHREKKDYTKILAPKYFHQWLDMKRRLNYANLAKEDSFAQLRRMENELNALKSALPSS